MAKKKNKNKIPKRIAGIKVPKVLRKSSGPLVGLLATPHGREAAAAALSAIAAALVGTPAGRRMAGDAGGAAVGAGSALAGGLETVGQAAGAALRQAAQSILPAAVVDDGSRADAESAPAQAKADPSKKQRPAPIGDPSSKH
jgi:hypothetical protein